MKAKAQERKFYSSRKTDQPDGATVAASDGSPKVECLHYQAAMQELKESGAWAEAGFPGATLADLVRIVRDVDSEAKLAKIRQRASRRIKPHLGAIFRERADLERAFSQASVLGGGQK